MKVDVIADTVAGPWAADDPEQEVLLGNAYRRSLEQALSSHAKTIAFPNIGAKPRAAQIALTTVRNFITEQPGRFTEIIFVCWDTDIYYLYREMLGGENRVI